MSAVKKYTRDIYKGNVFLAVDVLGHLSFDWQDNVMSVWRNALYIHFYNIELKNKKSLVRTKKYVNSEVSLMDRK